MKPWKGQLDLGIEQIVERATESSNVPEAAGEIHRALEQNRDVAAILLLPESRRMKGTVLDPMKRYDEASDEFHTLWVNKDSSDTEFDATLGELYDWADDERVIVR